jgi:YD repeat-containing protein
MEVAYSNELHGGYVSAGVAMRNLGYGTATISGMPSGSNVRAAYLLWDVLDSSDASGLSQGNFAGNSITGTAVSSGASPCWPAATNNYSFIANVTGYVTGNGSYALSGFDSGVNNGEDPWEVGSPSPELEGASLIVVYQNSSSPQTVVQLYAGSAETSAATETQELDGFTASSSPSAQTTFIVADGQGAGSSGSFGGSTLVSNFLGSAPQAVGNYEYGNLWDNLTFDVSSDISAGQTSADAAIQGAGDCLVYVGQAFSVTGSYSLSIAPASATATATDLATKNPTSCQHNITQTDPVDCASGDFFHTSTDSSIPGFGPALDLTRTYNSSAASTEGIFGYGWTSSYESHLVVNGDGSVTITEADGSQITATPDESGFDVPSWADSTLVENEDGSYTFVRQATQTFTYNSSGQLTSITDPNGATTTLAYSSGKLQTVTDPSGRSLTFAYGENGLASSVTDPMSREIQYSYDDSGNLTSVTDPLGDVTSFTY